MIYTKNFHWEVEIIAKDEAYGGVLVRYDDCSTAWWDEEDLEADGGEEEIKQAIEKLNGRTQ